MEELFTTQNIIQGTPIVIVAMFLIREMFAYLKSQKNSNGNVDFKLLNLKLDNHINGITKEIIEIKEDIRELKSLISSLKK